MCVVVLNESWVGATQCMCVCEGGREGEGGGGGGGENLRSVWGLDNLGRSMREGGGGLRRK